MLLTSITLVLCHYSVSFVSLRQPENGDSVVLVICLQTVVKFVPTSSFVASVQCIASICHSLHFCSIIVGFVRLLAQPPVLVLPCYLCLYRLASCWLQCLLQTLVYLLCGHLLAVTVLSSCRQHGGQPVNCPNTLYSLGI